MTRLQAGIASDLISIVLPELQMAGFNGVFPNFYRITNEHVDLLQFKFPESGMPALIKSLIDPLIADQLESDFIEPNCFYIWASYMDSARNNLWAGAQDPGARARYFQCDKEA